MKPVNGADNLAFEFMNKMAALKGNVEINTERARLVTLQHFQWKKSHSSASTSPSGTMLMLICKLNSSKAAWQKQWCCTTPLITIRNGNWSVSWMESFAQKRRSIQLDSILIWSTVSNMTVFEWITICVLPQPFLAYGNIATIMALLIQRASPYSLLLV